MKTRLSRPIFIFGTIGLLIGIGIIWLLFSKTNHNVVVPPDLRVERQVVAEGSGEVMARDIHLENGILTYQNGKQSRKLTDSELKTLVSKIPWPVNNSYTSDGGGDTALTSLAVTRNGEVTRVEFDDAWGTKVAEQVLDFDAYLDKLAGYPRYTRPR